MSDSDKKPDDDNKVIRAQPLGRQEEAIINAITQDTLNQANKIVDFSKAMITLVSAFFVAYFALLKFLGVETVSAVTNSGLLNEVGAVPIILILSLVSFAISAMPLLLLRSVFLNNITSLTDYYRATLKQKYIPMAIGMGLFISALSVILHFTLTKLL
jgi:cellulose synthase/poly-beta-1,6-N-acetylglucosamine synthase-like glycosyltransferase